jgi:hypothetical protein
VRGVNSGDPLLRGAIPTLAVGAGVLGQALVDGGFAHRIDGTFARHHGGDPHARPTTRAFHGGTVKPLVSVVVAVHNVARYLPQCLDSLLSQTLPDIEIILVNDRSTDNSLD